MFYNYDLNNMFFLFKFLKESYGLYVYDDLRVLRLW